MAETPDPAPGSRRSDSPWALLGVLAVVVTGLVLVQLNHWRWGSGLIGAALVLAGLLRAVLPARWAGLLKVRGRVLDVSLMLGLGLGIGLLAISVPALRPQ